MQQTITKIITFDAAHCLSSYAGPCSNLHGHTYKLEVTFIRRGTQEDMVVDFREAKKILTKAVIDHFDHTLLLGNCSDPFEKELETLCIKYHKHFYKMPENNRTTVESITKEIYYQVSKELPVDIQIAKIKVFETPSGFVETDYINNIYNKGGIY